MVVRIVRIEALHAFELDRPQRRQGVALVIVRHACLPVLVLATASQGRRRECATAGGKRTTASDAVAAEARGLVRSAVGDAAGLTIKGQIRQAARRLGYAPEDWRPKELWYGRSASAAAVDDLRRRHTAWREAAAQRGLGGGHKQPALAERLQAIGATLEQLRREVEALAIEIGGLNRGGPAHDG